MSKLWPNLTQKEVNLSSTGESREIDIILLNGYILQPPPHSSETVVPRDDLSQLKIWNWHQIDFILKNKISFYEE